MTSELKTKANRRNALASTGPRTAAGKASASRNATKHGLLSSVDLVAGEDADALTTLRETLVADLAPEGELEELLAGRVVSCMWRLARAQRFEVALLTREAHEVAEGERHLDKAYPLRHTVDGLALRRFGTVFVRCCNVGGGALEKLTRYEAAIERSLFRALHELHRLQAERGVRDSAPVAVDIHADVSAVGFVSQNALPET